MRGGKLHRSYIVDIPGLKDFSAQPGLNPGSVSDLSTSLHSMAGDSTTYAEGIARALRKAGANSTDPVMLVGHSLGGMTAVRAADQFTAAHLFNVTHVVTAGSPIARMKVPDKVQVLALENEHDSIPHLDAADNPPSPNRTTVTINQPLGPAGANHSLRKAYLPAAGTLDTSKNVSIRAYLESAGMFFSADKVRNHAYTITRDY